MAIANDVIEKSIYPELSKKIYKNFADRNFKPYARQLCFNDIKETFKIVNLHQSKDPNRITEIDRTGADEPPAPKLDAY